MSTFEDPQFFYVFDMKNGKKKLAYGISEQDAIDVLKMRLSPDELALLDTSHSTKIPQRKIREYIDQLG